MKEIGIKLADGSFYPIMEDGTPCNKKLVLTTVKDNQTRVLVDLYRSKTGTMEDAEYIDSLQIDNLVQHPNGSVELSLNIGLDENLIILETELCLSVLKSLNEVVVIC